MALELYMLGLIVQNMGRSLEFYRRLGLAIPEGSEEQTHVQIKMGSGLTFFLDSNPSRFDPGFVMGIDPVRMEAADSYLYWLLRVSVPKMIGADSLRYPIAH